MGEHDAAGGVGMGAPLSPEANGCWSLDVLRWGTGPFDCGVAGGVGRETAEGPRTVSCAFTVPFMGCRHMTLSV